MTLLNSNILTGTVLVTDSGSTIIYTNGVDYLLTSPDGILTQLQRTTNSTIPDGADVLVSYDVLLGVLPAGFNLSVTGNVEVAVGGAINAMEKATAAVPVPALATLPGSPADGPRRRLRRHWRDEFQQRNRAARPTVLCPAHRLGQRWRHQLCRALGAPGAAQCKLALAERSSSTAPSRPTAPMAPTAALAAGARQRLDHGATGVRLRRHQRARRRG